MAVRNNIPAETKLRLFSAAAGFCQNPDCLSALFPNKMGGDKHIAEMAHLIPHGRLGPRYDERPDEAFDTDAFDNLILLCPTCHTIIDKDAAAYPRELLLGWKQQHLGHLAKKQGLIAYGSRDDLRNALEPRMAENRVVWEKYAPVDGSEFDYDPESALASVWSQRMRSVILPNHYVIQSIIEMNLHLANETEKRAIAAYKEHVRGLTERHICGEYGKAIRFPEEMDGIFK